MRSGIKRFFTIPFRYLAAPPFRLIAHMRDQYVKGNVNWRCAAREGVEIQPCWAGRFAKLFPLIDDDCSLGHRVLSIGRA